MSSGAECYPEETCCDLFCDTPWTGEHKERNSGNQDNPMFCARIGQYYARTATDYANDNLKIHPRMFGTSGPDDSSQTDWSNVNWNSIPCEGAGFPASMFDNCDGSNHGPNMMENKFEDEPFRVGIKGGHPPFGGSPRCCVQKTQNDNGDWVYGGNYADQYYFDTVMWEKEAYGSTTTVHIRGGYNRHGQYAITYPMNDGYNWYDSPPSPAPPPPIPPPV